VHHARFVGVRAAGSDRTFLVHSRDGTAGYLARRGMMEGIARGSIEMVEFRLDGLGFIVEKTGGLGAALE
jgi:hypothetical protein